MTKKPCLVQIHVQCMHGIFGFGIACLKLGLVEFASVFVPSYHEVLRGKVLLSAEPSKQDKEPNKSMSYPR